MPASRRRLYHVSRDQKTKDARWTSHRSGGRTSLSGESGSGLTRRTCHDHGDTKNTNHLQQNLDKPRSLNEGPYRLGGRFHIAGIVPTHLKRARDGRVPSSNVRVPGKEGV